jgi:ribosomal protein L20
MNALNKSEIKLNRKMLADIAVRDENAFNAVFDKVMASV